MTRASVDFDDVVLRLDADDVGTTLVDKQFFSVELGWDLYRKGTDLRELVDRHTAGVPVIRRRPNPEWSQQLADAVKQHRRRVVRGTAGFAGFFTIMIALVVLLTLWGRQEPTVRTVDAGTAVTLDNGTTLAITKGPELIEHYSASIANLYTLQIRMCGGEVTQPGNSDVRNYFGPEKFQLLVGETRHGPFAGPGIPERPTWNPVSLVDGECSTGWLVYRLAHPRPNVPLTLRYANITEDRVTWRLPSRAPLSPVSKPCPSPTTDIYGNPSVEQWVGCPTPPPTGRP